MILRSSFKDVESQTIDIAQILSVQALRNRTIAGAGLDVFEQEPSATDNPLYAMENVILTPHSLCWTDQCFANIGAADIRAVESLMDGDHPEGIVNRGILENAAWAAKLAGYERAFSGSN